jgi:small basic protein
MRLTETDALDVALDVIAARLIFCAVTVVEDVAVSETAASRMRCAETAALDAAFTVIDASLGSIP